MSGFDLNFRTREERPTGKKGKEYRLQGEGNVYPDGVWLPGCFHLSNNFSNYTLRICVHHTL